MCIQYLSRHFLNSPTYRGIKLGLSSSNEAIIVKSLYCTYVCIAQNQAEVKHEVNSWFILNLHFKQNFCAI